MKVRSDWLVKLRISFAIHLRATAREFRAPENTVIVAEMNELKSFIFCGLLSHCFSIY